MHPSSDIRGTKGAELAGRKIALCITGSVAAIRCPELARELMRRGADVRTVMTESAAKLITPQLMHWATGNPVVTALTGGLEHVELASWADLVLVAPATANTLSKVAYAIDDTPVTSVVSVALGLGKPVAMVPAMHASMYSHRLLQENLSRLKSAGVHILEPRLEEGKAKLPSVTEIVGFVLGLLSRKDMIDLRVLVTAGSTIEYIDPIKFITNRSSGKMGVAIAQAAANRGADVTLIYGVGTEKPPPNVKVIRVQTTAEMREAVRRELIHRYDIIASAAAAQDFTVERPAQHKLRHFEPVEIRLIPAPRVIDDIRQLAPKAFIVGFKAEYRVTDEELLEAAADKLRQNQLDMVVANDVSRPGAGFGEETNEVIIVTPSEHRKMACSKLEIANYILDSALAKLRGSAG
ncbi:MAG: bifunctional phosphopantothenoylcysteine decarboxylase/phosphopantothenate--cysteine ligase CoaBC [Hadesarchaea archaeon]|nr:bifunctional phosphopantothenoylcysteine decarboxylase/phosphopantothenate--cysteine ligase CoaBC [Hadesarchaea archaeon]